MIKLLVGFGLVVLAFAAPAPQMPADYGQNTGPVGGVSPPVPTVTAPTGTLRGGIDLQGGIATRPPVAGGDPAEVPNPQLVIGQEADSKLGLFLDFNSVDVPQPIRGAVGETDPGPRTFEYEKLNPDLFAPPASDKGDFPNSMWAMSLSRNKLGTGERSGWARQQNTAVLPVAKAMAGVDMRLAPNAYRELHWHTSGEWALILKGGVRVAAMNENGQSFIDDVTAGDVWFFPPGIPHSLQALHDGAEFLLVFDDGAFSEEETFLATETFMRNPESVMAKNLEVNLSALANVPTEELYIFNGTPAPANISEQNITGSAGSILPPFSYTYHWSQQKPFEVPGGDVKILDPQSFPIAPMFSAALVTIQPGAMRELHWHTTSDEWNFFLQGSARMTIFGAPSSSRTFDFTSGDVGYVQAAESHYIENTGTEDVIFLEVLQAPRFSDISVSQWLALTPRQVVKDTLNLTDAVLDRLPRDKTLLKVGNRNMTQIAVTGEP